VLTVADAVPGNGKKPRGERPGKTSTCILHPIIRLRRSHAARRVAEKGDVRAAASVLQPAAAFRGSLVAGSAIGRAWARARRLSF
jgi:hypothetical protein